MEKYKATIQSLKKCDYGGFLINRNVDWGCAAGRGCTPKGERESLTPGPTTT